jgi:hypothetical protein
MRIAGPLPPQAALRNQSLFQAIQKPGLASQSIRKKLRNLAPMVFGGGGW